VAIRVHFRARLAFYDCRLRPHDRTGWKSCQARFKAHPHMLRHACGYALERCRLTSATATCSIRCAILSCHRRASRISGGSDAGARPGANLTCPEVGQMRDRTRFGKLIA